jgi:hypothetical protein
MIIYNDFVAAENCSTSEICSDAYIAVEMCDGAVIAVESAKVTEGGESINTGGNASKEEAEEGVEDEVKTVINVSHNKLTQEKLDKKEFTVMQNAYWKKLLATINKQKDELLGLEGKEVKADASAEAKAAAAAESKAAVAKLKGEKKTQYEALNARLASFKKNFPGLQKFVKDEILANFSEFDFYRLDNDNAPLGSGMIIPARYIGEAAAPTFYFYVDGLLKEKC